MQQRDMLENLKAEPIENQDAANSDKKSNDLVISNQEHSTPSNKIVEKITSAFFPAKGSVQTASGSKQTKTQPNYQSLDRKSDTDQEVELNDELEEIQIQTNRTHQDDPEEVDLIEGAGSAELGSNHTDNETGAARNENLNSSSIFVGDGEDSVRKMTRTTRSTKKSAIVSQKTKKLLQMQRDHEKT